MLYKIKLKCKYEGQERVNHNWGSLFHGYLMKNLPAETAALFHQSTIRPFSQYCTMDSEGNLVWTIGLYDCELSQQIIKVVMAIDKIILEQKQAELIVINAEKSFLSERQYFDKFFNVEIPSRRCQIEFLTPCAHKQRGEYIFFPNIELIINSLSKRYNSFERDITLNDDMAMERIIENIKIVRYSLYSSVFYLEKTKITGYKGKITIIIRGPEQLVRLTNALLGYGEYSGVGIKTALGMGAIKITSI